MARAYLDMTAEETNKFQVLIAQYRIMRKALWDALQERQLFYQQMQAINALGAELEAPADAIPHDARQGAKSIWSADPSWNGLINEKALADAFITACAAGSEMTAFRAAIGYDAVA
jgi:hypothetical protein